MTLNDSQRAFRGWLMAGLKAKWPLRICGVYHKGFVAKMATKECREQSPKKADRKPGGRGNGARGPSPSPLIRITGIQGG